MKIAIDARVIGEKFGIEQYFAKNLVEALMASKNSDHDITVYVPKNIYNPKDYSIKIIETDIKPKSVAEQVEFGKILKNEKYDLVHFLSINHPRSYRQKALFTLHSLYKSGQIGQEYLNYHHALDSGYPIIATNILLENRLKRKNNRQLIFGITLGIDDNLVNNTADLVINDEFITHLFCGCENGEYDYQYLLTLIEAFAILHARNKSLRLTIASTSKLSAIVKLLSENYARLSSAIVVMQDCDEIAYFAAQNEADYCILPWGGSSTLLSAALAMSSDSLILAANTLNMRTYLDQCAIYYKVGDPLDIKDKLEELISQDAVQECLFKEIRKRASTESWGNTASDLLKFYEKL
jgi:glycosyltransferase involved in cell wall biosynthesis